LEARQRVKLSTLVHYLQRAQAMHEIPRLPL
jgi:hypothetical protein